MTQLLNPADDQPPDWWTTDEWSTPPSVIASIVAQYGAFDLDACARPETAVAPRFYTKADDGLVQPWEGSVWVNPPYSDPSPWVAKAVQVTRTDPNTRVIMLLPASTDTAWFHDLVLPHADYRFIRGRIKFFRWDGKPSGMPKAGNILAVYPKLPLSMEI